MKVRLQNLFSLIPTSFGERNDYTDSHSLLTIDNLTSLTTPSTVTSQEAQWLRTIFSPCFGMGEESWGQIALTLSSNLMFATADVKKWLLAQAEPATIIDNAIKAGIRGVPTVNILSSFAVNDVSEGDGIGDPPASDGVANISIGNADGSRAGEDIAERSVAGRGSVGGATAESASTTTDSSTNELSSTLKRGVMKPILDGTKTEAMPMGRVIAPIVKPEPKPAVRPHGLPHFSTDGFPLAADEIECDLDVHFDITGNSTTEGKMEDILSCFNSRLEKLKRILVQSGRLRNRPTDVNSVIRNQFRYGSSSQTATIIGLVNDVRTKGQNLHFRVEDKRGEVFGVLRPPRAMDDSPEAKRRNTIASAGLMNDDVVGVTGYISPRSKDMFIVEDIHLPPLKTHEKRRAAEEHAVSVAFISDIHVGSNTFLAAQWEKMAAWFHTDPLARTIKYLVLSGDIVDGVGIYPNQDKELEVVDLYKQYETMAAYIEMLPDWLETIILPGNHDAVRPAEPQPSLDPLIQQYYNSSTFVGNPCDFSLHGVRILSYHGVSIMDFVSSIRHVTFTQPQLAMAEMLERRHLAPSWGGKTPLSPEPEDHMVIDTIPDIFVTGHVHGHHCGPHRGVTLIQSSTWQDQTGYMRMLGFQPKPCILTVVNLHTHETAAIPFA